ncbi:MAG: LuxR family transcriptional regulator [Mongoliibacter sp.]|uniref:response regulator transcription factor n=1 Tax=Mongoliibacter sp. TaxID=2022438 RepID=UPI0012F0DD1F|nr:helix-turn-helix transcriptional regulator [Mongoliibacter sp.]TVP47507.1 MAG: LuxR family transcriptional regulator [Mongoliibacter sp.]
MGISLIEELQKQNKLSDFFSYWNKKGPISVPEEKQVIEDLKKMSQALAMKEGLVMGCFDYRDLSLAFFTKNIEDISGYSTEFLESHGIAGVISALHPDDAREHVEFNNLVLEKFEKATLSEKKTFELSYTLRWLHKFTQEEIWFFTKAKPYLIDMQGNFIFDLHIGLQVTNHEHLTGYDWSFSYIKDNGEKVVFKKDDKALEKLLLTKKELEIAKLIAKGMGSTEIAEALCISRNTVFTHRKKILKKLNAKNAAEMVKILASLKLN